MTSDFYSKVLQHPPKSHSQAIFGDTEKIVWIDSRESVQTIVELIQEEIPEIQLKWKIDAKNDFIDVISVARRKKIVRATEEQSLQHCALFAIAELIGDRFEIRYVADTNGGDTAGIVVERLDRFLQLFETFGRRFNEHFVPLEMLPDIFNAECSNIDRAVEDYALQFDLRDYKKRVKKALAILSKSSAQSLPTEAFVEPEWMQQKTFQDKLDDGSFGPKMTSISPGSFMMGAEGEASFTHEETPLHEVTIAYTFAVSKFPITFSEWDACAADKGCRSDVKDEWGRGQMPVTNIDWNDAQAYVKWLSEKTGYEYRLLSEAEWEYAARGGTQTKYFWGNEIGQNNTNCNGSGSRWSGKKACEVGSFRPNAFGLYDMHGNTSEWVADPFHSSYRGAPIDGSTWHATNYLIFEKGAEVKISNAPPTDKSSVTWIINGGDKRVVRGGSCLHPDYRARSASRLGIHPEYRSDTLGFRIARVI